MKEFTYTTKGTCSRAIEITVDDNSVITSVKFIGGCSGNTQGVAKLAEGMKAEDVIIDTAVNEKIWENCEKILKKYCTNSSIFGTICNATSMRQTESAELSRKNDAMVVIGGQHSSNTKKLVDICKSHCADTYHIETVSELPNETWKGRNIGITAGASTPEWIIKEVISKMSKEKVMEVLFMAAACTSILAVLLIAGISLKKRKAKKEKVSEKA